jgi:peroxiredoxin
MPEVGDVAPDFELPSHLVKGKKVKLSDFRGQNNVVIAFYPLAWTPV